MLFTARFIVITALVLYPRVLPSQTAFANPPAPVFCEPYSDVRIIGPVTYPLHIGQQVRFWLYVENDNDDCTVDSLTIEWQSPEGEQFKGFPKVFTLPAETELNWYRDYTVDFHDIKMPQGVISAPSTTRGSTGTYVYTDPSEYRVRSADLDGSGHVDVFDVMEVINHWGQTPSSWWDINQSGMVDVDDLVLVLTHWGMSG